MGVGHVAYSLALGPRLLLLTFKREVGDAGRNSRDGCLEKELYELEVKMQIIVICRYEEGDARILLPGCLAQASIWPWYE